MSAARQLGVPLRAALIRYPALPLGVVAVVTFVWFSASNGGFDATTWYPGALIVLALVTIALVSIPSARVPRLVTVASMALFAYAGWSYLSIGWAGQKGDAWDGANRSLLYALAFALFALWRPRGRAAFGLVLAFALGVAGVGLVELLRASSASDPTVFFSQGRFASPAGYMNANVALWFSALFPCVTFGARREVHPALRALLVAAAVLLCGLAVIGQSRGWLFTAPVALLVFIAVVPQRVRTSLTLGLVLAATGVVSAPLLDVYRASGERGFDAAVSDAVTALLLASLVAGLVAWAVAVADRRARPSREQERRAGRALGIAAVCVAVVGLVLFVGAYGSPFTVAKKGWHEFKTEPSPYGGESRFTGSLGTNRYDFWRVAWDRFSARPLTGIGADNFQEDYLADRHSDNAPKYPHSFEIRAISQTGLVGTALLFTGVGAGLAAGWLAVRRRRGLGAAAAAAALSSFLYWLIHGSIDWFWEFPALGGAAFALLGIAAGLLPRPAESARETASTRRSWLTRARAAPAVVLALVLIPAVALAAPWFAEVEQQTAISQWQGDPAAAFDTLDSAASLNPLSATPKLLAGSIALRLGRRAQSEVFFRQALERDPDDAYAHLELGALVAERGRRSEALALLERAHQLDPRDDLTAGVLRRVRTGRPVNIARVNRQLAARSARLGR